MKAAALLALGTVFVACGDSQEDPGPEGGLLGLHVGDEVRPSQESHRYRVTVIGSDWIEWRCLDPPPCGRWGPEGELLTRVGRVPLVRGENAALLRRTTVTPRSSAG